MASALQRHLLAPRVPNIAAGFVEDQFAVVDIRRARRGFSLAASAVTDLPPGLLTPGFDIQNIQSPGQMAEIILQTAEAAGLSKKRRWSVALPEGAARTLVLILESKPEGRRELNEILSWKIERVIGVSASELRISRQRISPASGQERYLVTVAHEQVISEYESVFASVGWQAGVLLPRHMGEAQWLMWDDSPGDKMMVSANRSGFTSVVVRNGEPVLVRIYTCDPQSRTDELHRFALYYGDKLASPTAELTKLLVLGGIDLAEAQHAISDAIDIQPHPLDLRDFGLDLANEPILIDHLAGAAGLATIAFR